MPYIVNLESKFNKKQLKDLAKPYLAHLSNEVYLISKGVRSCAWIGFPNEIVPFLEKDFLALIKIENLNFFVLPFDLMIDNEITGHIQIFIYKYTWQKELFVFYINKRNSLTAEFIFGKLLGYSDESINQFLTKNSIY